MSEERPEARAFAIEVSEYTETILEALELITSIVLIFLFATGLFDLMLKIVNMVETGAITDPLNIIKLIDTVLLLLIIVEIYRTVIAYLADEEILPIVINVGIIAMARKIISFRTDKFATPEDALLSGLSYGLLLLFLVGAYYVIHVVRDRWRTEI